MSDVVDEGRRNSSIVEREHRLFLLDRLTLFQVLLLEGLRSLLKLTIYDL